MIVAQIQQAETNRDPFARTLNRPASAEQKRRAAAHAPFASTPSRVDPRRPVLRSYDPAVLAAVAFAQPDRAAELLGHIGKAD